MASFLSLDFSIDSTYVKIAPVVLLLDYYFKQIFARREKLKTWLLPIIAVVGLMLVGCLPASQVKKVIEDNPDIVFNVIEKNPEKFIEVVNKAARSAQQQAQQKEAEEETKKRDEEFANPLKPELDPKRAYKGPADAPITIVEYSDFECPYCRRGWQTVQEVLKEYDGKIRMLFKNLPLEFHPKAMPAAKIFEAIALQDAEKAYKWHDEVFKNSEELRTKGEPWMKNIAKNLGVDMKKLEKDINGEEVANRIKADGEEAKKFEIRGTPGFIINGVSLKGAYPASEFKKIIDKHLEAAQKK
jgi:protein-disulfide isomerase